MKFIRNLLTKIIKLMFDNIQVEVITSYGYDYYFNGDSSWKFKSKSYTKTIEINTDKVELIGDIKLDELTNKKVLELVNSSNFSLDTFYHNMVIIDDNLQRNLDINLTTNRDGKTVKHLFIKITELDKTSTCLIINLI